LFSHCPARRPPMDPHAPNEQRTLFDVGCTKRKRTEGNGQPWELHIHHPTLAQRVAEHERVLAAAIAAKPLLLHLGLWAGQGWRGQLAEMLLMLEHKAQRGAGAEAGAGAGAEAGAGARGGTGLGRSWRKLTLRPQSPQMEKWRRGSELLLV